jgi:hypothetical protein
MDFEKICREYLQLCLEQTDALSLIMDHGKRAEILAWRQLIRDFPETEDFPDVSKIPAKTW